MAQNKVQAITRGFLVGSSLTSSYQPISAATGLGVPCFRIALINSTDAPVDVSYDGVNDHDVIAANSSTVINAQTNSQPPAYMSLFGAGQVVYVKGSSGAGNVYLSGYYVP